MTRLKYMSYADEAVVAKGDTLGDRLSDGLTATLVFNKDNGWVVDTDALGLSQDEVDALLEADPERFKDVTDLKRIPSNMHQKVFLAHGATQAQPEMDQSSEQTPLMEVPDPPVAGASDEDTSSTPVPSGGSTRGRARG